MAQAQIQQPGVSRSEITEYKRGLFRLLLALSPDDMTDGDADTMASLAGDQDIQVLLEHEQ